jgi:recombination protein RecR
MSDNLEPIERLTDMFRRLDGVGRKTAERYAHNIISLPEADALEFAEAIIKAKTEIKRCTVCCNISTGDVCDICGNDERDHTTVCVVEDPKAVMAIEKTRQFRGVYHVLHGTISPMRGVTPDKLTIKDLLARINNSEISEVILATNPTVEGEATAMYIAKLIVPLGVKATRIANGVPVGGDLEYTDEVTLRRALEGRYSML